MNAQQSHVHQCVPHRYLERFLTSGKAKFSYLDLRPETVVKGNVRYQRRAVLLWGVRSASTKMIYAR